MEGHQKKGKKIREAGADARRCTSIRDRGEDSKKRHLLDKLDTVAEVVTGVDGVLAELLLDTE